MELDEDQSYWQEIIEHDIYVLVEKPITRIIKEAVDLVGVAEKNDVVLMVGHIKRFSLVVEKLRDY